MTMAANTRIVLNASRKRTIFCPENLQKFPSSTLPSDWENKDIYYWRVYNVSFKRHVIRTQRAE